MKTMTKQHQEQLSALFDNETSAFETRRLLQSLSTQDKKQWQRYQLMSDALSKNVEAQILPLDMASRISAAIADEPTLNMAAAEGKTQLGKRWLKPVAGFAVAASVAFVTVVTLQQNPQITNNAFVAEGDVSASQLNIQTNQSGLSTASGAATLMRKNETSRQSNVPGTVINMDYYLRQNAEQSSFNAAQGLVPMGQQVQVTK